MAAGPQTLGRYQLERVLGKGAMGIVYEALDPKLHRRVAIKTILISQLDEETAKDFSMRFVREAHAVARLNHPNIVQVYDFGEEGDVAYLVMEFIRGNELKSTLTTGQLFDRKECVRIMCELLDALDFAHEAGVVHRDIKPANVMLDNQGRTKLTDFGVARVTDADRTSAERTQAGTMVGTPAYMSPEQIQGQRIDRRTDIFSAGIILYQFLTGQKPFTGEGAWTVAKKIIQDDPPMPSSINVALSAEFDRVVAKALAKNPDQRFATAREFAHALRRAAEGKPAIPEAEPTVVVALRLGFGLAFCLRFGITLRLRFGVAFRLRLGLCRFSSIAPRPCFRLELLSGRLLARLHYNEISDGTGSDEHPKYRRHEQRAPLLGARGFRRRRICELDGLVDRRSRALLGFGAWDTPLKPRPVGSRQGAGAAVVGG